MNSTDTKPDISLVAMTALGLLFVSLFLNHAFATRSTILFLTGAGLGITLFHASFGFAGGWRQFVRKRRGAPIRAQLLLLAGTSLLFFPVLGSVFPQIHVSGAFGPVSLSVLVGAFLFGVGMQLGGGCGSGTLYTVGGGHVRMLITLSFFVVGTVVGSTHLPWWLALPNMGKVSLIESFGWLPALLLQALVLGVLYLVVARMERRHHGRLDSLAGDREQQGLVRRLVFGPWPLGWGIAGLALLGLVTLLVAGHPGYPAAALNRSVLADTTSLMDFGIILGAVLAAGLAGRFAPPSRLKLNGVMTAILGGLLLGYGARLAFGCNIGGMLAGIASGSLHGWLWLFSGFLGSLLGVRLRIVFGMDPPAGRLP
jgi:uncharacterized membrane protein YedE/YeeE